MDRESVSFDPKSFESFFENFLDVFCFASPDGYFLRFNRQLPKLTGYSPEELLEKPFLDFVHPNDKDRTKKKLEKLNAGEPSINFQNRYICADGSVRWFEWSCVPMEGHDYLFAMARDVTVRHAGQEAFLEAVLDNIPDMIFVKDAAELRFQKFNKAGEELLGFTQEDLLGKNDYDFFPKDQANFFTGKDRAVIDGGKMVEIDEEEIQTRLKGKRVLHTKKIPLFDDAGNPQYLIGISEDITEKKEAELIEQKMREEKIAREEVEKSLRARDEFLSIASHELKSPLSALKLQAQMFKRNIDKHTPGALDEKKIEHLIELTQRHVDRLTRLVNDMLDVSRIRTGRLSMDFGEFDLVAMIRDVLFQMRPEFLSAACGVPNFVTSHEKVIGRWDRLRIEQVLVNLLNNAIRYGCGTSIDVRLSHHGDKVRFWVRDQGPGIPPEQIDKIFERFERAMDNNDVSGLGLGLYISRQIVRAHGGEIWVEDGATKGAKFVVELPVDIPK